MVDSHTLLTRWYSDLFPRTKCNIEELCPAWGRFVSKRTACREKRTSNRVRSVWLGLKKGSQDPEENIVHIQRPRRKASSKHLRQYPQKVTARHQMPKAIFSEWQSQSRNSGTPTLLSPPPSSSNPTQARQEKIKSKANCVPSQNTNVTQMLQSQL